MLKKFEGFNIEEAQDKWFNKGERLTVEEISGLFGLLEAKEMRLEAIKEVCDSCFILEPKISMEEAVLKILSIVGA